MYVLLQIEGVYATSVLSRNFCLGEKLRGANTIVGSGGHSPLEIF